MDGVAASPHHNRCSLSRTDMLNVDGRCVAEKPSESEIHVCVASCDFGARGCQPHRSVSVCVLTDRRARHRRSSPLERHFNAPPARLHSEHALPAAAAFTLVKTYTLQTIASEDA